ncbi:MacB-like periplasmic core domain protein [uncultured archaeon]|nr:MacB-like periplasmic core domain protein [uncultured archaeon]
MRNREIAGIALNSLRYRSLRSWLAILGIVIGVASIISLISISVGMNDQIEGRLTGLGANIITVTAGSPRAERMGVIGLGFAGGAGAARIDGPGNLFGETEGQPVVTFKDADSLASVAGVAAVDARLQERRAVSYKDKNSSLTVIGTSPSAFPESTGASIAEGRSLESADMYSAVLGFSVATETFNDSMLNRRIKIGGTYFRVVGVLNQSGASFTGPDSSVFIPIRAAQKLFGQKENASSLVLIAADGTDPEEVAASVTTELSALHGVSEDEADFSVATASSLQSSISSITDTLAIFLGGIASISLIVGGVGVANAMFTSVLEQTKFIGLLKALGARNGTVMKLFLFEACTVGFIGGIFGIALSFLGSALLASFGLPSRITIELVLLGLGFSIAIGAISGLLPARNAASVPPVEALKYE